MQKIQVIQSKKICLVVVLICLCSGLVYSFQPEVALACSGLTPPPDWKPPTIQERVDLATTVLEGTVLTVNRITSNEPYTATVQVYQYFKGRGPVIVKIRGFNESSLCFTPVESGERAIFLTWGNPETQLEVGNYWEFNGVNPVFGYRVKEPVSPGLIASLLQASHQAPFIPASETATTVPTTSNTPSPALTVISAIPANPTLSVAVSTQEIIVKEDQKNSNFSWLVVTGLIVTLAIALVAVLVLRKRPG